jgi:hypothetical protein
MRRWLILASLGASLGTLLDWVHVATRTTEYTHTDVFSLAWWVPFEYAAASVAIGVSHPWLDSLSGRRSTRGQSRGAVVAAVATLACIWAGTGLLHQTPLVADMVFGPAVVALWWIADRTPQGAAMALATAAMGVAAEWSLSAAGFFRHLSADWGRVPSWLPWIYAAASVAIGNLGRRLSPQHSVGQ